MLLCMAVQPILRENAERMHGQHYMHALRLWECGSQGGDLPANSRGGGYLGTANSETLLLLRIPRLLVRWPADASMLSLPISTADGKPSVCGVRMRGLSNIGQSDAPSPNQRHTRYILRDPQPVLIG
jgi:hypothetical protein